MKLKNELITRNVRTKRKTISSNHKIQPRYAHLSPVYGDILRKRQRPILSTREEALQNSSHYNITALEWEWNDRNWYNQWIWTWTKTWTKTLTKYMLQTPNRYRHGLRYGLITYLTGIDRNMDKINRVDRLQTEKWTRISTEIWTEIWTRISNNRVRTLPHERTIRTIQLLTQELCRIPIVGRKNIKRATRIINSRRGASNDFLPGPPTQSETISLLLRQARCAHRDSDKRTSWLHLHSPT